jgi:hypothetical protein
MAGGYSDLGACPAVFDQPVRDSAGTCVAKAVTYASGRPAFPFRVQVAAPEFRSKHSARSVEDFLEGAKSMGVEAPERTAVKPDSAGLTPDPESGKLFEGILVEVRQAM